MEIAFAELTSLRIVCLFREFMLTDLIFSVNKKCLLYDVVRGAYSGKNTRVDLAMAIDIDFKLLFVSLERALSKIPLLLLGLFPIGYFSLRQFILHADQRSTVRFPIADSYLLLLNFCSKLQKWW